jgi:hypothetical protein
VKCSILIFYVTTPNPTCPIHIANLIQLRIFTSKWFKIIDLLVLASVVAIGIAASLAVALQCHPISLLLHPIDSYLGSWLTVTGGAWNRTIHPKCINLNLLAYATGAIFVAQDVVILILPIFPCLELQMGMKKKLQVIFMFSIGAL